MTRAKVGALLIVVAAACGNTTGSTGGGAVKGPPPSEMCSTAGEAPALVAYDRKSGAQKWVVCSAVKQWRTVEAVKDNVVFVSEGYDKQTGKPLLLAFRAADGKLLSASEAPEYQLPPPGPFVPTAVDGVLITGGQDDPTTAIDAATGKQLWTKPGSPVYDDVWAIGDGAVFVVGNTGQLVAYELKTGVTRWSKQLQRDKGWPWHVDRGVLFAVWTNLSLISTKDGSIIWQTDYPAVQFPRMSGVRADDKTVYVSFTPVASGGD